MILMCKRLSLLAATLFLSACLGGGDSTPSQSATRFDAREVQSSMVGVWATSPYGPYPLGPLTRENIQVGP